MEIEVNQKSRSSKNKLIASEKRGNNVKYQTTAVKDHKGKQPYATQVLFVFYFYFKVDKYSCM